MSAAGDKSRWPRPSLGAVADTVGLVLAAITVVSFLVVRGGWLLGLSCAVLVAGAVGLALCWRRRRRLPAVVAAMLIMLGAGGAGAALARAAPARPLDADLRFSPVLDPVPYCRSYPGTGTVPDGYQLLIFDRGATGPYYFHSQAERANQGWVARRVGIGLAPTAADPDLDEGARITLYAQMVTEETARVLRDRDNIAIYPERPDAQWLLRKLPGRTVDAVALVRAAGLGECIPA
ncbi:AzlD domain-containing protein [Mangrovihabitans endophyticus]|uniref:Uncharacterized protein n=1 Tax=Mangrovihabitans endophyticus TaxID=1751298 RepID=A0A8J3FM21_9ACTN|nr:AzlD domain-containing protein [Mangrovihabitans endophyticus]GGK76199.1 hypothetical protein GCM10012284_07700 [Mangrovihabitans endophyticus]